MTDVEFLPARSADERPAVRVDGGALVFVYLSEDGELVITVDTEEMDRASLPVRFNVNNASGLWTGTVAGPNEEGRN